MIQISDKALWFRFAKGEGVAGSQNSGIAWIGLTPQGNQGKQLTSFLIVFRDVAFDLLSTIVFRAGCNFYICSNSVNMTFPSETVCHPFLTWRIEIGDIF